MLSIGHKWSKKQGAALSKCFPAVSNTAKSKHVLKAFIYVSVLVKMVTSFDCTRSSSSWKPVKPDYLHLVLSTGNMLEVKKNANSMK